MSSRAVNSWLKAGFYILWAGLAVVIVYAWGQGSWNMLRLDGGNALLAAARFCGLLGAFLLLWQLVLVSRSRWLERIHGFDRWTRIHRLNGIAAFTLVTLHIPLVITGNALLSGMALPNQARTLLTDYSYVWMANLGYLLLLGTLILSVTFVRRHVRYETWYWLHLLNYLMLGLVFWHQVAHGLTLAHAEWFLVFWYGIHIAVVLHLLAWRFLTPLYLAGKHRFRVEKVVEQTPDVYSVYVSGRKMQDYRYQAGQFAKWRFWQRGLWMEEHPFTISTAYNGEYVRLSVKQIGDYTESMAKLQPGSRVWLSQPLGNFTLRRSRNPKLLLIAGGIGITPLRAMFEVASERHDIILLYTAQTKADFALVDELRKLAADEGRQLHLITTRERVKGAEYGRIDAALLHRLVPDIGERTVFLCGPAGMMDAAHRALLSTGVAPGDIHSERFSL